MSGNVALARVGVADRAATTARVVSLSRVVLLAAIVAGVVVRFAPVLAGDFPLNDGGLFCAMIRDLQQAGYQLPPFTSYNNAGIPFTYPPLPFYFAGLIDDLTPLSLFDVLRLVPATAAALSIGAVYLLARSFHSSDTGVAVSVATFALLPESFVWPIMGGGLTRALGMVFALLGMREAHRLYAGDNPGAIPWLILWSSLAILSHLEWALFLAVTSAALCISFCRSRRGLAGSFLVAAATIACTAPWWATVLSSHGWAPITAALLSGHGTTADVVAGLISLAQILVLAAALLLLALRRRRPFFLGWVGLILLFNLRSLFRFAAVPIALANGDFFDRRPADASGADAPWRSRMEHASHLAFGAAVVFMLYVEVATPLALNGGLVHLSSLSPDERAAMAWVNQNADRSSRFLVVSGDGWAIDRSAEWFPVLANRTSVGTVQGTEWLPGGAFAARIAGQEQLDLCAGLDGRCLERWSDDMRIGFTHVYIPGRGSADCCAELRASLRGDSAYAPIHESAGASIFARAAVGPWRNP